MMQTKAPAPIAHAEQAAGTPAQRSVSSVPGMGASSGHARPQAVTLQRMQTSTRNSARVKQLGGMQGTAPPSQRGEASQPSGTPQGKGLPPHLKHGIEHLSGISMDGVTVHYNSPQPAQLRAHAFAQGSDIHLGPGQEAHLPHEAWHVVQQAQGRVAATTQMAGAALNDDTGLEHEADVMGARAMAMSSTAEGANMSNGNVLRTSQPIRQKSVLQRKTGLELELDIPFYGEHKTDISDETFFTEEGKALTAPERIAIVNFLYGGLGYGESCGKVDGHYDITADHSHWSEGHRMLVAHIDTQHIKTPDDKPRERMSNLEYRTVAVQEGDPLANATMRSIATKIQQHAVASATLAQSGRPANLPLPVAGFWTGIPIAELFKLMKSDPIGLGFLEMIRAALNPTIHYQTTIGVPPSEIPMLFDEAAQEIEKNYPSNSTATSISKKDGLTAAAHLRAAVISAKAALGASKNRALRDSFKPDEQQSLLGWLSLIAQYLIASDLETTSYLYRIKGMDVTLSASPKNLLPYLSKIRIPLTPLALPRNVQPVRDDLRWHALAEVLAEECSERSYVLRYALELENVRGLPMNGKAIEPHLAIQLRTDIGVDSESKSNLDPTSPKEWLIKLFDGEFVSTVNSGHRLGLDPAEAKGFDRSVIEGEQGIPLEDRVTKHKGRFGDAKPESIGGVIQDVWVRSESRHEKSTLPDLESLGSQIVHLQAFLGSNTPHQLKAQMALETMKHEFGAIVRAPTSVKTKSTQLSMLREKFLAFQKAYASNAGDEKSTSRGHAPTLDDFFRKYGPLRSEEQFSRLNELHQQYLKWVSLEASMEASMEAMLAYEKLHDDAKEWSMLHSDTRIALSFIRRLLEKKAWDVQGKQFMVANTAPKGIVLLRAELKLDLPDTELMRRLHEIGKARLKSKGKREQVTSDMYALVRDAGNLFAEEKGWAGFLARYKPIDSAI